MRLASSSLFTTFCVPVTAIAPLVPDLGAAIARRIPADNAALELLVNYLASPLDTEALVTPELQQLAVTHVLRSARHRARRHARCHGNC